MASFLQAGRAGLALRGDGRGRRRIIRPLAVTPGLRAASFRAPRYGAQPRFESSGVAKGSADNGTAGIDGDGEKAVGRGEGGGREGIHGAG